MRHWKLVLGFVLLCLGGVGAGFFLHFKHKPEPLETAKKNLQTLALAIIRCAEDANGKLPPSIVYSKEGKPLYSWRVRILPYIGEKELYEKLNLDEAWDSPHNKPLLAKMPEVFKMPGAAADEGTTYFQVFEEAGTLPRKYGHVLYPDSFSNGPASTILIAEGTDAVFWAAPLDIPYSKDISPLSQVGHRLGKFTICVTADGTPRQIETTISEKTWRQHIDASFDALHSGDW